MTFEAFLTPEQIRALQESERMCDKDQKRTEQQIEAIYTSGQNVLVSASAGSGKTFVMVERILDKIKRGVGIDQLFISTFTVKAADELKVRIEKKLLEAIRETKNRTLRHHLSVQLNNLGTADIGTMDAFTQKLVTQYGYILGISPNFRVLQDKNEQDLMKQEVFSELFTDYMEGLEAEIFRDLVKNFSGNRKDTSAFRSVVYQIYTFSQSTSDPTRWLKKYLLKGYEQQTSLASIPDDILTGLIEGIYQTVADLQDLTNLPEYKQVTTKGTPTVAYTKHLGIITELRNLAFDFEQTGSKNDLPILTKKLVEILPSGSDISVASVKYSIFKNLKERLKELQHLEIILTYQSQILPLLAILQQFVLDFSNRYLVRKMQENAYEFSDISHFAIQILEENVTVRQLFQEKYEEVMVDEYQDNNHSQERMLDLLSNGHNRFMVGDIKQSIYRFRQADPLIFQDKFETYQHNKQAGKLILLKENFRSQSEVLDATNAIFTRLMDCHIGQIKYDANHILVAGSERQKISQPRYKMEYLIYNTDMLGEEANNLTVGEVEMVAKEIIRLHNEEGVSFSDITLLVPSRTRNDSILKSFEKHGIPLISDGGEANYLKSLEVMVMLDTLRSINNPLNDYALVALLKSPMFSFDEDELARIALQDDKGFFYEKLLLAQAGKGKNATLISPTLCKKITEFTGCLQSWRTYAKIHSLYDLIWKIFNDKFYYDYVGAMPNGSKRQANLYALGLRANQFEQTGFKGLARFISMIDKIIASDNDLADVAVELPSNAVQLMTVHKSKGLEFKYVFLLNMDKKFNATESRNSIILSRENGLGIQYLADMKERFDTPLPHVRVLMDTLPYQINKRELKIDNLSEQMRLLYVAMTRAECKLYLVGKGSKDKLSNQYDGKSRDGVLLASSRERMNSFQDWILAIEKAFGDDELYFTKRFVEDEDLTVDKIGQLKTRTIFEEKQKDNRQSDSVSQALSQLEAVEALNQTYRLAIELPSVRTPSQIKKFYEPILSEEGIEIMEGYQPQINFELPNFSKNKKVTGAQVGAAVHELMQRLELASPITEKSLREALSKVDADQSVKSKISLEKILSFFSTDLGKEILFNTDKLRREVAFASLVTDPASQEDFVLRGIVDGFLHYGDRIVLFDYKTDRYEHSRQLTMRYQGQMKLYAQSLQQAYGVKRVDAYLILLGGETIEVVQILL